VHKRSRGRFATAILRAVSRRFMLGLGTAVFAGSLGCHRPTVTPTAAPTPARQEAGPSLPPELAAAVDAMHNAVEAERLAVGTPAAALLVVKDNQVIHAQGYGLRGGSSGDPVDADTQFAIGSATKAFTAMLVMQAVDAGALKLSDHPSRCLPGFTLKDPQAAAAITVRDLMTHGSGLGRTDMAWYVGGLSRAELLQVAAKAEPMGPLGKQVHYQNIMVMAAGECAANALGGRYEALLKEKIWEPLGISASVDAESLRTATNRAQGHARVGDDGKAVPVPVRDLEGIAPAGAMNASLNGIAPWLKFMVAGGELDGTRLVSEDSFDRIVAPHIAAGPGVEFGLGWVLDSWRGQRRIWHNGGVDGYYALVSMLPDSGLGFVLLTADDGGELESLVTEQVFGLVHPPTPESTPPKGAATAAGHVGVYGIVGGFQAVVATDPDTAITTLAVPGQPPYPLEAIADGSFRLGPPAPEGLSASFASGPTRTLTIRQPQGPVELPWLDPAVLAEAAKARVSRAERTMLATYHDPNTGVSVRLVASEGRVALSAAGQAPAPLVALGKDKFGLDGLPNAFAVTLVRHKGSVVGIELTQPQGALSLARVEGTQPVTKDAAAIFAGVAKAHGSKARARHTTLEVSSKLTFVHQGMEGTALTRHAAPGRFSETLTLVALDKAVGTIWVGDDGNEAWERSSFSTISDITSLRAEALRLTAPFAPWVDPMAGFAEAEVMGVDVLPGGNEPAILIKRTTASGIVWVDAIGRSSSLLLQRTTSVPNRQGPPTVEVQRFGDYRRVDGVNIAHLIESTTENGTVVSVVESARFDAGWSADSVKPPAR